MCHKYGSATKAVREVPLVKYAKKLANQVLSSLKYLREGTEWERKRLCLEYPPEEEEDNRPYVKVVSFGVTFFLLALSTELNPAINFRLAMTVMRRWCIIFCNSGP
jgi:uncharacterized protein (DUF2132 family)